MNSRSVHSRSPLKFIGNYWNSFDSVLHCVCAKFSIDERWLVERLNQRQMSIMFLSSSTFCDARSIWRGSDEMDSHLKEPTEITWTQNANSEWCSCSWRQCQWPKRNSFGDDTFDALSSVSCMCEVSYALLHGRNNNDIDHISSTSWVFTVFSCSATSNAKPTKTRLYSTAMRLRSQLKQIKEKYERIESMCVLCIATNTALNVVMVLIPFSIYSWLG